MYAVSRIEETAGGGYRPLYCGKLDRRGEAFCSGVSAEGTHCDFPTCRMVAVAVYQEKKSPVRERLIEDAVEKTNYLPFATWLRAASAIMILTCHYCIQCETPVITSLAHIFNIGVPLFFIMSGFLTGFVIEGSIFRGISSDSRESLSHFRCFISIVRFLRGYEAAASDWRMILQGLQDSAVSIPGDDQTWCFSRNYSCPCYFLPWFCPCCRLDMHCLNRHGSVRSLRRFRSIFAPAYGASIIPKTKYIR